MLLEERLPEPPPELEPPELFLEFEPVAIIELDGVAGFIVAVEDVALGVEGVATAGAAGVVVVVVVVVVTLSIMKIYCAFEFFAFLLTKIASFAPRL